LTEPRWYLVQIRVYLIEPQHTRAVSRPESARSPRWLAGQVVIGD
jgi:hypothetical protein